MASTTPFTPKMTPYATKKAPPFLPAEIWLQILEHSASDSLPHLWTTIRPLSKTYAAHVERIFVTTYLPIIHLSLSLPRLDPRTGALNHTFALPGAEIVFQFTCLNTRIHTDGDTVALESETATPPAGSTMEKLREEGKLTKGRLDGTAGIWMWFGRNRGKGGSVKVPVDVRWDDEGKVWRMEVEWKTLCSSLFGAKVRRAKRVTAARVTAGENGVALGEHWRRR